MDDMRVGRMLRAIRHRLGWRQEDVATRARVSQDTVSRTERGRIDHISLRVLRQVARALDADVVVSVRWRGGELDRLLDEGHAALVGAIVGMLEAEGWIARPEVSFSAFGERGSIDVLAWHPETRTLLVIEVKTELTSVAETLRKHDVKVRLAARIARDRFGWSPQAVGRLLVLPGGPTARRQVHRHDPVLGNACPARGAAVRRWLRGPAGAISGLLFLPLAHLGRGRHDRISRKRIRARRSADT
jgi:transcriptional regulator with XRE-family HTH domain